ncbi:hypothetical protein PPYR_08631 [Photinus pyralis]|uniref:Uncharacterized protein n=2 Tax=Photinus pyralis TaxID=7054 RepID=A0A5N4AK92_PHOPY|nr:uncharacterized protein LOC116172451 [Photinus pyralis]KAB0797638.1 hypothetical protein PPYR_08631 [Photinus pyralis]
MSLQRILVLVAVVSTVCAIPKPKPPRDVPPGVIICAIDNGPCVRRELQSILGVLSTDPASLGIGASQPLKVNAWTAAPGYLVDFPQKYKNLRLYNHIFNRILNVQSNVTNTGVVLTMNVYNPEVALRADFEFQNATFLGVPVSSRGSVTYRHQGYWGTVTMSGGIIQKGHEKYLSISNFTIEFNASKVLFSFKTGNSSQDASLNQLFGDNWDIALNDVKASYEALYAYSYSKVWNTICSLYPFDSLFLS